MKYLRSFEFQSKISYFYKKQERNCVPKRRWLYDVWWRITKKIFLNDNFALFILSWLQKWNHLGVGVEFRVRFKNCFGVYTSSWPKFIFYVSFNSNLWFSFNFGVVFGLFLGSGYNSKTVFGSTHVVKQLSFSVIP